jgi:hypothetical protein
MVRRLVLPALGALVVVASGAARPGAVSPAALMAVERAAHTATLLGDGRVLVAGGIRAGEAALASAELYDSQTGRFTRTGDMTTVRSGQTATLLRDGRVLLVGGWDDERPLASAEIYDPATGRFFATGDLPSPRAGATATRLRDGRVLVAGGSDGSSSVATAVLFDLATTSFTPTGRMRSARATHTSTLLRDGRVLVAGGNIRSRVLAGAELYDPASGTFSRTGSMTRARYKHAAALLRSGRVLVLGGSDARDWDGRYRSSEVYDPRSGRFTAAGPMSAARFKLTDAVTVLADGRVLVAGGSTRVEAYQPARRRFARLAGRLDAARYFSTATRLPNGSVLIVGGYDRAIRPTARAFLYRP